MVNAGRILILAKGAWNSTTNYTQLDLVSYNSIAYLARQASVGVNPSTDTQMVYWMPFGSAASIATTSTPGLVMPDGQTITITNTGLIKAVLGLNDVSDVTITSPANGQVLKYNTTTQKWENASLGTAAAKNATDTITSGSTDLIESGAVHSAIQTLTNQASSISDEIADMNNVLGAKNVLPNSATSQVINGVTFTVNSDGSIGTSGTSTDGVGNFTIGQFTPQQSGKYILSGCDGGTDNTYFFNFNDGVTAHRQYDDEIQLSLVSGTTYTLRLWINASNVNMSDKIFYPMIRPASIEDDTYVPYAMTNRELSDYYYNSRMDAETVYTGNTEITPSTPTYTAQHNGLLSITCRIGSTSTITLTINNRYVASYYTADTTASTASWGSPVVPLVSGVHVKAGDVIRLLRTYGDYAWVEKAIINYQG